MLIMESILLRGSNVEKAGSNHIYIINGNGNREEVSSVEGLEIVFSGENNVIEIYANLKQEFLQKYPEIELGENIINPL